MQRCWAHHPSTCTIRAACTIRSACTIRVHDYMTDYTVYAYADNSTLLAVVRKPTDGLAVAASLSREFARILEVCITVA